MKVSRCIQFSRKACIVIAVMVLAGSAQAAGQSPAPDTDWGPLAVLDDSTAADGLDAGNGPGRVRITDTCVVLRARNGHEDTLAWRSGDTRWDPTTHEVVFVDDRKGVIRISQGDQVELGGFGGFTVAEPPDGPLVEWLVPPDATCPPTLWVVHEVVVLTDAPTNLPPTSAVREPRTSRRCMEEVSRAAERALREDIAATAKARRWTIRQAETAYCSTQAVGRVAAALAAELPETLVGSVVSEDPMSPPSLYVKGVAPDLVRDLVASEDIPIVIVDSQPFSYAELESRQARVHEALVASGYGGVMTSASVTGAGIINVSVGKTPGLTDDPVEIVATVPADLRPFVVLRVVDPSVEKVTVTAP